MTNLPVVDLQGKRLLVTGAAGGIGRAVALRALAGDALVWATDVRGGEVDGLTVTPFDLRDVGALDELCRGAAREMGGLDGLVHVAGVIVRRDSIEAVTEADWDLQTDVNLKATFFLDRAAARVMAEGGGGAIVNFASQGWWTGGFGGSVIALVPLDAIETVGRAATDAFRARALTLPVLRTVSPAQGARVD